MRPPPLLTSIHVGGFAIGRHGRFWRVVDPQGRLIVTAVYKKGALEVVRRLLLPDLRPLVDATPRCSLPCRERPIWYDPQNS